MYTGKPQVLKDFASDERGAVAMLFGLMLTALLFLAGMAVDYTRAVDVRTRVSDAADSAALAAGRALMEGSMDVAEIKALATKYFNENVKGLRSQATLDAPDVTVDPKTGGVTINVQSHVKLTLARIMGKDTLDFPITSVANFAQKDIEVGMALDITGSMNQAISGGGTKIAGLKKAFESFADRLIPSDPNAPQKVRIGLAPYSAGINIGSVASAVARSSKDGCVTEAKGGSSDTVHDYFVSKDGVDDVDPTQGYYYRPYLCPKPRLVPLSDDKAALMNQVNNFKAEGGTAGHLGVQWAWNLVSDRWSGVFGSDGAPASYDLVDQGKLIKAVVLMTDGVFNTSYHGKPAHKQALELCDSMKAKGVVVFSVGFGLDDEPDAYLRQMAKDTLKACASPGQGYFADASSTEALEAAFNNFAAKLTELRIAK